MMRYLLAALLLAAAPAWGQQVPNPVNAPASITSGHLYSATSNRQQAGDSGASVSSLTVTWPSSGQAVISHGDNSPTGVAAANYNCLVGNSTPAWVSGACGTTPQGRLSLTSAVAVMTGNVSAATTVYYVAYTGLAVPVWNGTNFVALAIPSGNLAMGLDSGTPHIASGSIYDVFGVSNSGTLATCTGPAWSTTSTRGTGAGTTQIDQSLGLWTNTVSLTHCWGGASGTTDYGAIAANKGTYLGSIYATGNGQTTMDVAPVSAAGGGNAIAGLFNAYNRVSAKLSSADSNVPWSYNTSTWRVADNNNNNRATWLDGLQQISVTASYQDQITLTAATASGAIGILFDATSGTPTINGTYTQPGGTTGSNKGMVFVNLATAPLLGLHFAQAMEWGGAVGSMTFGGSPNQSIILQGRY